jgi:ubiquinone biosynthesis protein
MINVNNPIRNLQRYWQVQSIFLRYGFDILVDQNEINEARKFLYETFGGQPESFEQYSTPQKIRLMLQELGPTYVKLGQIVSSQSNVLPPDWITELQKLQSDVPPFPSERVEEIVEGELDAPLTELFQSFSLKPLAAASIGQAHRATMHDGQEVIVKVQRPDIVPQIDADLKIIREVARLLENSVSWAKNYGTVDIVNEFARNLRDELDYRNEGRNADRLRRNMASIHGVHIPVIYWELSTTRILTMEFIDGVKITNLHALDKANVNRAVLVNTFMRSMIHQLLVDGFFHGDPHPGNVFALLNTAEVAFLDLGMMGRLASDQRTEIINLLQALQQQDALEIVRIATVLGIPGSQVDEYRLRREIERLLDRYMTASLSEVPFAELVTQILNLIAESGIRLPSDLTLALKALIQTEEVARTLKPDIQITDVASTLSQHLFAEQFKPEVLMARLNRATAEVLRLAPLMHGAMIQTLRQLESGRVTVKLDVQDLPDQVQDITAVANRFTIGLVLAGMIVGSAITMAVPPEYTWWFIPFLGLVGFVISMAGAGFLVFGVMWDMWRRR